MSAWSGHLGAARARIGGKWSRKCDRSILSWFKRESAGAGWLRVCLFDRESARDKLETYFALMVHQAGLYSAIGINGLNSWKASIARAVARFRSDSAPRDRSEHARSRSVAKARKTEGEGLLSRRRVHPRALIPSGSLRFTFAAPRTNSRIRSRNAFKNLFLTLRRPTVYPSVTRVLLIHDCLKKFGEIPGDFSENDDLSWYCFWGGFPAPSKVPACHSGIQLDDRGSL